MRMTKKEAVTDFMEVYKDSLLENDQIANKELWFTYIDSLCKDGLISKYQYNNWAIPSNKYFK